LRRGWYNDRRGTGDRHGCCRFFQGCRARRTDLLFPGICGTLETRNAAAGVAGRGKGASVTDQSTNRTDEQKKAEATRKRREALVEQVRKDVQLLENIIRGKAVPKKP